MERPAPSVLVPALIGGAICGTVSAIPIIEFLNCVCCSLIIGAGFIAAFFHSRNCRDVGAAFRAGNGVVVGLVAGVFYAVFNTVMGAMIALVSPVSPIDEILEGLEQAQQQGLPPEVADQIVTFLESGGFGVFLVIGFAFSLVFGLVFGAVGGAIGGAVFKVEPPEVPAPPDAPAV